MDIRAAGDVAVFVRARGGVLYVWTSSHRCCSGPLTLLDASAEAPRRGDRRLLPVAADGFEVLVDFGRRHGPRELVLELGARGRSVRAHRDDRAFVG